MEKSEIKGQLDSAARYLAKGQRDQTLDILDSINWKKVRNVNMLLLASDIYEDANAPQNARELLETAHDRSPIGRMIIYRLALLSIKLGDVAEAEEYYDEFVEIAPHDSLKYVIKYQIQKAKNVDAYTQISTLEELKNHDFIEEWAFELACLYRQTSQVDKCINMCDEIVLWFGEGPYVEKALEMKMLYQPLDKDQEDKYRAFQHSRDNLTEIRPEDSGRDEILSHTIQIPRVELNTDKFSTVNLQAEIKKNIEEIMQATEAGEITENMEMIKGLVEDIPYLTATGTMNFQELTPEEDKKEKDNFDDTLRDVFKGYLEEEYDGQYSIPLPDYSEMEEQVAGQMTITEVMEEWEKTKRAVEAALQDAEKKKLEIERTRALEEANQIMDRLVDVGPRLEAGVAPETLLKEQYLGEALSDVTDMLQEQIDSMTDQTAETDEDADVVSTEDSPAESAEEIADTDMEADAYAEEADLDKECEPDVAETESTTESEDAAADTPAESDEAEAEAATEPEEAKAEDNAKAEDAVADPVAESGNPETSIESVDAAAEAAIESEDAEAETATEPEEAAAEADEVAAEAQTATETNEYTYGGDESEKPETEINFDLSEYKEESPTVDVSLTQVMGDVAEALSGIESDFYVPKDAEESVATEPAYSEEDEPEIRSAEDAEYYKGVSEVSLSDTMTLPPIEYDPVEFARTKEMPELGGMEQFAYQGEGETLTESADDRLPEPVANTARLSDSQRQILSYFAPIHGMEESLYLAITGAEERLRKNDRSSYGNIMIIGKDGSGRTTLAADLIEIIRMDTGLLSGVTGRITGANLNQKDLHSVFDKISGGCLIIEDAGDLNRETAVSLSLLLENDRSGTLIILEDKELGYRRLRAISQKLIDMFTERIEIPDMTIDELVNFGKAYVREQGYSMDDMAVLALYDKINIMQHQGVAAISITMVRDIIEDALSHAKDRSSGLFGLLSPRGKGDGGNRMLIEKDFV